MREPLVSIMMPTYNAGKWIQEAINSIINQTYTNWELLILDDGSTDNTRDVLGLFSDDRIKIIYSKVNLGVGAARSRLLDISIGEIIAKQDSDDSSDPNRILKQVKALQQFQIGVPRNDIVSCRMIRIKGNVRQDFPSQQMNPVEYFNGNTGGSPICPSIVAWKYVYEAVNKYGGFGNLRAAEDGLWNLKTIALGFRWGFVDEPLYWYYKRGGSLTEVYDTQQIQYNNVELVKQMEF